MLYGAKLCLAINQEINTEDRLVYKQCLKIAILKSWIIITLEKEMDKLL